MYSIPIKRTAHLFFKKILLEWFMACYFVIVHLHIIGILNWLTSVHMAFVVVFLDVHVKQILVKSIYVWNDAIKRCSLALYGAVLFIWFLSWHTVFVLNLREIGPSFAFCWRWRGHQSRLRSDSLKFTMPEEFPHKSTCFTSLSMELTFGQALGQCRNYW